MVSLNEEALIVYRASLCNVPESTRSKLQYDPSLTSVPCSSTDFSTSGKLAEIRKKGRSPKKLKSLIEVPNVVHVKVNVVSFNMILISSP